MSFRNTLQDIDNAASNLTDVHAVDSLADLFATTAFVWHEGDVAIVAGGDAVGDLPGKGTYVYRGTDQVTAGTTVANDWLHLTTPTDAVESVAGQTGVISKSDLLTAISVEDGADVTPAWVPDTNPNYLTTVAYTDVTGTKPPSNADVTPSWVPETNPNYLTSIPGDVIRDIDFTVTDDEAVSVNINGTAVPFVGSTQLPTDSTEYPAGVQNVNVSIAYGDITGTKPPSDADVTPDWVPETNPNYLTTVAYGDITGTKPVSNADVTPAWVPEADPNYLTTVAYTDITGTKPPSNADVTPSWVPSTNPNYLTGVPAEYLTETEGDNRYASINDVGIGIVDFPTSGSTFPFTVSEHTIYETGGELWLRVGADVVFADFSEVVQPTQGSDWHELPGALPTSATAYPAGVQNSNVSIAYGDITGTKPVSNADVTPSWVPETNPNYLTTVAYGDITGTKPPSNADATPSWVPDSDPSYLTTVAYGDITGTKPPNNADVTPSWVPETNP